MTELDLFGEPVSKVPIPLARKEFTQEPKIDPPILPDNTMGFEELQKEAKNWVYAGREKLSGGLERTTILKIK